jgi:hypothetical protein
MMSKSNEEQLNCDYVAPVIEDTSLEANDASSPLHKDSSPSADSVKDAVNAKDWDRLRELSLRQGGFGSDRIFAWYVAFASTCVLERVIVVDAHVSRHFYYKQAISFGRSGRTARKRNKFR